MWPFNESKVKVTLSDKQKQTFNLIKKTTGKIIVFDDTRIVWLKNDSRFLDYNVFMTLEFMELVHEKRKIGRNQYEYVLNRNNINKYEII